MSPRKRVTNRPKQTRSAVPKQAGPGGFKGMSRGAVQLLAICGVALAIQLAYLVDTRSEPTFWRPIVDAAVYDKQAREIAAGTYTIDTPYYHPPLFTYFLAVIYRLSGNSMLVAKLVLALVGALSAVLTTLTARLLTGRGPAWIAGLMAAVCGPLIFYNAQLLPAGLATMLNVLLLYLLLRAGTSGGPGWWLAAGVAAGLAADTVPNLLIFVPFVPAWLLWKRRARSMRSSVVLPTLLLLSGLAAAILPVTLANYRHSGQLCLISYNGGLNFYIGNNLNAEQTIAIRPSFGWENLDRLPVRSGVLRAVDQDRFYVARTLDYAREHPGHFVQGLLKKARQITNARELPRNVDIYMFREWSVILSATVWRAGAFAFPFGLIFPLACLGMIAACRERRNAGLLALYVAVYTASVVASFVTSRYRVVLMPALIVFAAHAVAWMWERRREVRRLAPGVLVVLLAAGWSNTHVSAPTDGIPFAAEVYNLLALQSIRDRDYEHAARDLDEAALRAPGYADAQHSRGLMYMGQGSLPEARDSFLRAIAIKPGNAEAHANLGGVLGLLGDRAAAEAAYREAMRLSPETPRLFKELGALLCRQGRLAEGVPLLRNAIALDLTTYEAYAMLAWIMATCPDAEFRDGPQAVEYASTLLRQAGQESNPVGIEALAAAHAERGDFTRAVATQEQAMRVWSSAGRADAAQRAEQRLALYRQGIPFRDASLARSAGAGAVRPAR